MALTDWGTVTDARGHVKLWARVDRSQAVQVVQERVEGMYGLFDGSCHVGVSLRDQNTVFHG